MTAGQTASKRVTTPQLIARIALVLIVGGAVTALALTNPDPDELADIAASSPPVQTLPAQSPPGQTRVIDSGTGLPPGWSQENLPAELRSSLDGAAPRPVPAIANPEPWQYDPVTNQHWEPNHKHWHVGQPPSPAQRAQQQQQPAISNPQPWQYDPVTNKHWEPNHQHWHPGQPPPPDQRGE